MYLAAQTYLVPVICCSWTAFLSFRGEEGKNALLCYLWLVLVGTEWPTIDGAGRPVSGYRFCFEFELEYQLLLI